MGPQQRGPGLHERPLLASSAHSTDGETEAQGPGHRPSLWVLLSQEAIFGVLSVTAHPPSFLPQNPERKKGFLQNMSAHSSTLCLREPEPHFHPLNNGRLSDWLIKKRMGPMDLQDSEARSEAAPGLCWLALPPPWEPTDRSAAAKPGTPGGGAGWSSPPQRHAAPAASPGREGAPDGPQPSQQLAANTPGTPS